MNSINSVVIVSRQLDVRRDFKVLVMAIKLHYFHLGHTFLSVPAFRSQAFKAVVIIVLVA